jgi:hypothetical protein
MKYIILFFLISLTSCSQNTKNLNKLENKNKIDTIIQYKFVKTIDDIDLQKLTKVQDNDVYLKKIRKEYSLSATVYEIETLELNKNFISKVYLVWQEAAYTTLNLVNISLNNVIIDETELSLNSGDGNEAASSIYSFIDNKHVLFSKYYLEYDNILNTENIQVENILKTIEDSGKITNKIIYSNIKNN